MLLVIAAIVVGVIAIVRWRREGHKPTTEPAWPKPASTGDPVITELRSAYARGDITWTEYAQRAANLGYQVPPEVPPPTGDPASR